MFKQTIIEILTILNKNPTIPLLSLTLMDILLLTLGILALIIGFIESFLPVLPGPPIAWAGLLLLHFSAFATFSTEFLLITAAITIVIALLDYFLPIKLTKKFGGTKAGERGATIGTIIGIFLGPLGIIFGPLVGAFAGEIITNPNDTNKALKVAFGSFVGFLLSTGVKLIWCMVLIWWFVAALF